MQYLQQQNITVEVSLTDHCMRASMPRVMPWSKQSMWARARVAIGRMGGRL
jgi:hypothetical protein